jgi:hypothetical protein
MSQRAWKSALLALHFAASFARTGSASCASDVGTARAERLAMHCRRVNTATQASCAAIDCLTLSTLVQAYCGAPKGRPALCGEYPALVTSKHTGIPPDLERIAATAAEDRQVLGPGLATLRETLTLVTSVAASVKSAKTTVEEEQKSFAQRATAAFNVHKRYKAVVASKASAQLAQAPKLLESVRTEFTAAATIGESLLKHTAELRDHERRLGASVRGADTVGGQINSYARDAINAALVMDDALRAGTQAGADAGALAHVKELRDPVTEGAKEAAKASAETTKLVRQTHVVAEVPAAYDWKDAEARASAADVTLKRKVDAVKRALAGLSGTSGNICDKPMLERAWKASGRTSASHGAGLVPVVLHTLDAKTLGQACPFLKATLGLSEGAPLPAGAGAQNVDVGSVTFADLGLEIMVLVDDPGKSPAGGSGPKCTPKGCGHTFFVNEGGGFTPASGSIVTPALAGFARRGVDIFAMLADAEWKLRRTPGKPSELVFSRAR